MSTYGDPRRPNKHEVEAGDMIYKVEKAIRDWRTAVLAGLALVCPVVLGVDPSLVVLLAGAIGLLLFRPKAKSEGA